MSKETEPVITIGNSFRPPYVITIHIENADRLSTDNLSQWLSDMQTEVLNSHQRLLAHVESKRQAQTCAAAPQQMSEVTK